MYDKELVVEVLKQISDATEKILARFEPVTNVSDFTHNPAGIEKMDSICMLLIVIGESLKNLDKITDGKLLQKYPEIDWKKAKGMRDILTHHYADISAEAVFRTCKHKMEPLHQAIKKMIKEIK
ncbi:MAG: DUF86 domain-containing protein [Phycisphaerae bacterium]